MAAIGAVAVTLLAFWIVRWRSDPIPELREVLEQIRTPESFAPEFEESWGSNCLAFNCAEPTIRRFYTLKGSESPSNVCRHLQTSLVSAGVEIGTGEPTYGGSEHCYFEGELDGAFVTGFVYTATEDFPGHGIGSGALVANLNAFG
jgi:hypothetical protein